jgi:hypothetical protein
VRASFLFLLLANILFMAWTVWVAPASGSLGTPAPVSDPTSIRRVGEPPAGERPTANGATVARSDDAGNALNALRTVGLTDAYVVAESGPGIVISVGVFSDPERAEDAAAAIRRAGLDPTVSDRLRPADVTWLDIDRATNGGLPEAGEFADVAPKSGPVLEMRACPAAA